MRLAFAEHRTYDAVRLLRMAADHEDAAEKHPVTPGAVRPARELLGDLLMEMHQPKEALVAYRKVLAVAPGRRNAIGGAAEAARMAGMSSKLHEIRGISLADGSIESGPLAPRSPQRAGKYSGEVELFYLEFVQQFIEKKHFRIGLGLALPVAVGGGEPRIPLGD
jgi:hypothetical protein